MALTQQEWFDKLKGWVPVWFWEEERYQKAHLMALAKLLATAQQDAEDHIAETFILTAAGKYLDEHGEERSVARLSGEVDAVYRERVRNIVNQSNLPAIRAAIDGFKDVGSKYEIWEAGKDEPFFNQEAFFNQKRVWMLVGYDAFIIIIDAQASSATYDSIVEAVNAMKALGVVYSLSVDRG